MTAVEFLPHNVELRSLVPFFRHRSDCTGTTWKVAPNAIVKANDVIGHFTFAAGAPVPILAPIDGTVVRTFNPNVADLPHRPSVLVALFKPKDAPDFKDFDTIDPWFDVRADLDDAG